jgi:hypothetical protein
MAEYNFRDQADIVALAQECAVSLSAQPLIDYFERTTVEKEKEELRTMVFEDINEIHEVDVEQAYKDNKFVKEAVDELVDNLYDGGGFNNDNIDYWMEYNESAVENILSEVED